MQKLAILGLSLCALVVVIFGITRGDWLQGFLAGITMAMAVLPEEFPVVLTIFLALGAWRISQNKVLTRRIPAVETLGATTVLCTDKTGTLTENRMTVKKLFAAGPILQPGRLRRTHLQMTFMKSWNTAFWPRKAIPLIPWRRHSRSLATTTSRRRNTSTKTGF